MPTNAQDPAARCAQYRRLAKELVLVDFNLRLLQVKNVIITIFMKMKKLILEIAGQRASGPWPMICMMHDPAIRPWAYLMAYLLSKRLV
jgi:hypothetical protein